MQKINFKIIFILFMISPGVMASTNSSSAINTVSPGSTTATQTQGVNPFSAGQQSLSTSSTPSLIIRENELLSQEVKKWVESNSYKLYWNSKKDYVVYNKITLSGKNDDEILQSLGELFFSENYGLVVKKYQKNRVIVIDDM